MDKLSLTEGKISDINILKITANKGKHGVWISVWLILKRQGEIKHYKWSSSKN